MMDVTDRHCRYFLRLISPNALLYSEMITADAIIHGDRDYLLSFNKEEHPLALQLGGSDPKKLAQAIHIADQYGYDEFNLNVGCPSDRVQSGAFGACLMKQPELVRDCLQAMQTATKKPITIKTRIGVDDQDSYEELTHFVDTVKQSGVNTFIVHARKAWLKGLSPKENRNKPPLQYQRVYQLKKNFPGLEIIINGGVQTLSDIQSHLQSVDGVMIGRAAYNNPFELCTVEKTLFNSQHDLTRDHVAQQYIHYLNQLTLPANRARSLLRHMHGLYFAQPGARMWRRQLSGELRNKVYSQS